MNLTAERVLAAYDAIGSGDRGRILEYWHEDVRFLAPGNHAWAGWHEGLDSFLAFLGVVGRFSGGTFGSEILTVLVNDEGYSVDVNRSWAQRAGAPTDSSSPYHRLDVEAVHLLRWVDGRVVEGRGALFGDAIAAYALWWSPLNPDYSRTEVTEPVVVGPA